MTVQQAPICIDCANGYNMTKDTCDAFPNGIPEAILKTDSLHLKPMAGDNDITFKPDPELGDYDFELFWEGHPDLKEKGIKKSEHEGTTELTSDTQESADGEDVVTIFRTVPRAQE